MFVFDTCEQAAVWVCQPRNVHTQLDPVRLAQQEKNVEAGQVTEYEGITYATIKVCPYIATRKTLWVAMP